MASAAGIQGADKLADNLAIMPTIGDMFSDKSDSTAASNLSTGNWGTHSVSITKGLDLKQVLIWGGLGMFAYWILKKIRGK